MQIAHLTFAICIFQFAFFFNLHFSSICIFQFSFCNLQFPRSGTLVRSPLPSLSHRLPMSISTSEGLQVRKEGLPPPPLSVIDSQCRFQLLRVYRSGRGIYPRCCASFKPRAMTLTATVYRLGRGPGPGPGPALFSTSMGRSVGFARAPIWPRQSPLSAGGRPLRLSYRPFHHPAQSAHRTSVDHNWLV
jgi:hypothetical protein